MIELIGKLATTCQRVWEWRHLGIFDTQSVKGPSSSTDSAVSTASGNSAVSTASGTAAEIEVAPVVLSERNSRRKTAFAYSSRKKWAILSVIFVVQVSMNFNASVYTNGVGGMMGEFEIGEPTALIGQWIFLIAYALGSEFWAPWSEEFGRWPVLQWSLFFVNIWQIPCALSTNFTTIIVSRALGGLSSAGGSVTLGMVADMWDADHQQYAVAFIVFSSVGGSVVGPIAGGFIEQYLNWRWVFWIQLLFGVVVQFAHTFVPETRSTVLLDRDANRRRLRGALHVIGPTQAKAKKMSMREIVRIWKRPFHMFLFEPIVLLLSLLSGFSDALIFTFLSAYTPVYQQWGFSAVQLGLAFIPIGLGYIISYLSFLPFIRRDNQIRMKGKGRKLTPERRLYWLLYTAPLMTVGLLGFSWCSLGPAHNVPWIAPMLFSVLVGVANYAIYMATIDYMIASYGPYSASATGGNALARDLLAGLSALYVRPFFTNLPAPYTLELPTTILACLAALFTLPIYVFYYYGERIRKHSTFAEKLAADRGNVAGTSEPATQTGMPPPILDVHLQLSSLNIGTLLEPVAMRGEPGRSRTVERRSAPMAKASTDKPA